MKRLFSVLGVALLVAASGYLIWNDKDVQRFIAPAQERVAACRVDGSTISCPAPTNTPVSPTNTLVPPTFARDYADAFCRADAATIAAATDIEGVTEEAIAAYFSGDPACLGVRYLGQLVDGGVRRYIFALDFEAGRVDWVVFTFNDANMLTGLNRG